MQDAMYVGDYMSFQYSTQGNFDTDNYTHIINVTDNLDLFVKHR